MNECPRIEVIVSERGPEALVAREAVSTAGGGEREKGERGAGEATPVGDVVNPIPTAERDSEIWQLGTISILTTLDFTEKYGHSGHLCMMANSGQILLPHLHLANYKPLIHAGMLKQFARCQL